MIKLPMTVSALTLAKKITAAYIEYIAVALFITGTPDSLLPADNARHKAAENALAKRRPDLAASSESCSNLHRHFRYFGLLPR